MCARFDLLQVDFFHIRRRPHHALELAAVIEAECMTELVNGLFREAAMQEGIVPGEPVKLVPEPLDRYDGGQPLKLRLSEDERKHRHVEIDADDCDDLFRAVPPLFEKPREHDA